jgi:hypothetical protein
VDAVSAGCRREASVAEHKHPFPGQQLRYVEQWNNYHEINEDVVPTADLEEANIITSEIGHGIHKVLLDIDMPVKAVPSSTEGHFHLFIDKELTWDQYADLIRVLVDIGIVEDGYYSASAERGYTSVRVPWVPKVIPQCAHCGKHPEEIPEYVEMAEEEGFRHASQAVRRNEGTYNLANGHFYCTKCYIIVGTPNGVAP